MLTSHRIWFIFPLASWGVGLAFHYIGVFGIPGLGALSKDWEEREMQKELRRMGADEMELEEFPEPRMNPKKMDIDDHLELKEVRKNYDDSEFV